jgi:hypothetical protein
VSVVSVASGFRPFQHLSHFLHELGHACWPAACTCTLVGTTDWNRIPYDHVASADTHTHTHTRTRTRTRTHAHTHARTHTHTHTRTHTHTHTHAHTHTHTQRYAEDSQFAFNFDDDDNEPENHGSVAFVNTEFGEFDKGVQLLHGHRDSGKSQRSSRYLDVHPDDH